MYLNKLFRWVSALICSNRQSAQRTSKPHELSGIAPICFNTLTVKGPRQALEEFRRSIGGCDPKADGVGSYNEFCFNTLLPLPDTRLISIWKRRSQLDLSALRESFWKVDSNAWGVTFRSKPFELYYSFSTLGVPPVEIVERLLTRFPKLKIRFEYINESLQTRGTVLNRNGEMRSYHAS